MKTYKIMSWNINNFCGRKEFYDRNFNKRIENINRIICSEESKVEEVKTTIVKSDADIIFLYEVFDKYIDSLTKLENYNVLSNKNIYNKSHSITIVLVRKKIETEIKLIEFTEYKRQCLIKVNNQKVLGIHQNLNGDKATEYFNAVKSELINEDTIIVGDLNCEFPLKKKNGEPISYIAEKYNKLEKNVVFNRLQGKKSFVRNHIIDNILYSDKHIKIISEATIGEELQLRYSDHNALYFNIKA